VIRRAEDAKRLSDAAKKELKAREVSDKESNWSRFWFSEGNRKNRGSRYNDAHDKAVAERKEFHKMLKAESDKKNAADLERRRAAGLIWEPVAEAGGDACAAVFSSRVVWDALVNTTRADGTMQEAWLDLRHVAHLCYFANIIAEACGVTARLPYTEQTALPHWPIGDNTHFEGIRFRKQDLNHLVGCGFFTVAKEPGFLIVGYGTRTLALIDSYQKALAKRAKG
jgi:hypothetical protein